MNMLQVKKRWGDDRTVGKRNRDFSEKQVLYVCADNVGNDSGYLRKSGISGRNGQWGKRYKQWYQKYVLDEGGFGLQLSSDMAYSIRCSLLHEGNPSIDKEKCNVKCFAFIISDSTANKTLESSLTRRTFGRKQNI